MQDRYVGDIGDFAKFGLLRYILSGLPQLKLGVQWYELPDEAHNTDKMCRQRSALSIGGRG